MDENKKTVLIIEDDKEINDLIKKVLVKNNINVIQGFTGLQGVKLIKENGFDLVVLDLMLPFKSGDEILMTLRSASTVPVIVISAKGLIQNKIELLNLGADDYLTKPFDIDELLARIEANLRRSNFISSPNIELFEIIKLENDTKKVYINDLEINLTAKEFNILKLLIKNPRKVFSKANLFESVWNDEYINDDNTLNVHISNLRKKINIDNTNYIETVWGLGYRLANDEK